jgi:DNA repair protein RecN (Recombination protein N)
MIKSLSIRNYALIDQLDFGPSENLSIITGETGAGKSIMLGALGLLLGNRADTKVLWDEAIKCKVEGVFDLSKYRLREHFSSLDLDYEEETIIRREIAPSGKSRAFINDMPVTLDILKSIGSYLMDIHSQHESLQLGNNDYQRYILDAFAQHPTLLTDYKKSYTLFSKAQDIHQKLLSRAGKSAQEEDYKRFVLSELEDINLDDLDQEELESQLELQEHAEEIKAGIAEGDQLIDAGEVNINQMLSELSALLRRLGRASNQFEVLSERVESTAIELKDIHGELQRITDGIVHDPEQKEVLKSRLDELYRLQTKHRVDQVDQLISLRDQLRDELQEVDNMDEAISKAGADLEKAKKEMLKWGKILTEARKHHAIEFSKAIEQVIQTIGIENGKVVVDIQATDPGEHGMDHVEVLFSANKGIPPKELKYVASGGEFSRLIFAIKYLIADKTDLPTVIFDEIDTGVSGEIAIKMIRMMRKMARNHQVIAISHLPQFAAGGNKHFFVYKNNDTDKTVTRISELSEEERVEAIAKMIGGDNPTSMAFESARELLSIPA